MKELLVKNFDIIKQQIDFEAMGKQETHDDINKHMKEVLSKIYSDKMLEFKHKLKLVRLIRQKYTKVPINMMFLTIYENIQEI